MNTKEGNVTDLATLELKNKQFLEQSWGNIVEDADVERRLLQDIEDMDSGHGDEGFKVVSTSKNKQIKKKPVLVSSYKTRVKPVLPKPFK